MKKTLYIIVAGLFLLAVQVSAQAPNNLNYQGVARNSAGAVLPSQSIGLEFTIHQGTAGGTIVYQETQTTTTNQFGLFTVSIGSGTVVAGSFSGIGWSSNNEYLDVAMDPTGGTNYTDMGAQQLLSVPYALFAAKSGGVASSPWTTAGNNIYNNNAGAVGIGTTTPLVTAELQLKSLHTYGGYFTTDTASGGYAVIGYANANDGYGYGGYFTGGYTGCEGWSTGSTAGYSYYGSYNNATSSAGSYTYGTYGAAQALDGLNFGVTGTAEDLGNGLSIGVYGSGSSQTGMAYGLYGVGSPIGSYAFANGKGYHNTNVGDFLNEFSFVVGVDGEVTSRRGSNFTKENIGVLGVATNPDDSDVNWGVLGYAAGSSANDDIGVGAWAQTNDTVAYTYGVFAYVNPDGGASTVEDLAGEFIGDLDVEGTLSKSAGTFKIDDPLDPANKYLYHSFVESPDMMNVYNGNIITDANGDATVTLPQYFQAENKDFKYQLTVIGQFAQAIIGTKVNNNQFTIKTDKPNVEVSWQVTGVRNDPYANEHRVVAEVEKKGVEKGHYLFPQYYGQPKSMSISSLMAPSKSIASLSRKTNVVVPKPQPPTAGGNASLSTAH